MSQSLAQFGGSQAATPAETGVIPAIGTIPIGQQRSHSLAVVQRQRVTSAPGLIAIRLRLQVRLWIHGPSLRTGSHHAAVAGVVHSADRLTLPTEQLAACGGNGLANSRSSLPWIAVHLTLGVTAEVVSVDAEAMAVGQRPRAGQNGLCLQGAGG
ncbi:MAG: Uncharacterised protein [Synechococcus sp. CC9902]|nr:MAG: Uncharacterised protein [Synechococcus sp. CC9902]